MEDDYFNKMSDEVDMDMDMNEDDTFKNEDCSKFFTTIKVIIEFDLGCDRHFEVELFKWTT